MRMRKSLIQLQKILNKISNLLNHNNIRLRGRSNSLTNQ